MNTESVTATSSVEAQNIEGRIESLLFGGSKEPVGTKTEEAPADAKKLPVSDDSEVIKTEGSDSGQEGDDGDNDGKQDDGQGEPGSLAEYLGVDDDNLFEDETGKVMVKAKIDGEAKIVPFKEVIASYQLQGHVNNLSMALQKERGEFREIVKAKTEELQSKLNEAGVVVDVLNQQILAEYNSVDWDRMRLENPGEWAAAQQDFKARYQAIMDLKDKISNKAKESLSVQQEQQQQELAKTLAAENEKLLKMNPTWADQEVRKKEVGEIRSFLVSAYGFSESDMENVYDSRLIALIQDAMSYRKGKQKVEQSKTKQIPNFKPPGRKVTSGQNMEKARNEKALNKQIRDTNGSVKAIADKILDRL